MHPRPHAGAWTLGPMGNANFETWDFPSQCQSVRAATGLVRPSNSICVDTAPNLVISRPSTTQSNLIFLIFISKILPLLCFILPSASGLAWQCQCSETQKELTQSSTASKTCQLPYFLKPSSVRQALQPLLLALML